MNKEVEYETCCVKIARNGGFTERALALANLLEHGLRKQHTRTLGERFVQRAKRARGNGALMMNMKRGALHYGLRSAPDTRRRQHENR